MPPMTPFGWFHTIIAVLAVIAGVISLAKHVVILSRNRSGLIYLVLTAISAGTALGIYKHGGFGVAHALAVLTLGTILMGLAAERLNLFGRISRAVHTTAYTATFLFNMIPAITETLLRWPGGALIESLEDPLLQGFHGAFVLAFLIGLFLQYRWLKKQDA